MYRLLEFFRSIHVVLLFVILEAVAINYYAHSSYFTQARLLATSSRVTSGVGGTFYSISNYYKLGTENQKLADRVAQLENQLAVMRQSAVAVDDVSSDDAVRDESRVGLFEKSAAKAAKAQFVGEQFDGVIDNQSNVLFGGSNIDSIRLGLDPQYEWRSAKVVSTTINRSHNYLIINKGVRQGVKIGMTVVSPEGALVGSVIECSDDRSVAISILNVSFQGSGKIKGSDYFGSLGWDYKNRYHIQLDELSKYSNPSIGDTIVSTGFSRYIPQGVMIGTVNSFKLSMTQTHYTLEVELAADLSSIGNVLLIGDRLSEQERMLLESKTLEKTMKSKSTNY